ncbi:hypothetical protein [Halopiger thermotolerans]
MTADETEADGDRERDDEHLRDVADGCGCAEIWEHASEQRQSE